MKNAHALLITIGFCFGMLPLLAQGDAALKITPLTGDFYVFETYNYYKNTRVPANGMYVVTSDGVVLFDTPWDTTQFQPLLDSITVRHKKKVILAFASHFHEDRTAGLEYYRERGIKTFTTYLTDSLSKSTSKKRAEFLIQHDTTFTVGSYRFEVYYPGHGHTLDNIVVWFEKERVLYGGCLIKSTDDKTLGNLSDANPIIYAITLEKLKRKYRNPKYVIPGHNSWANPKSLDHTYRMAIDLREKTLKEKREQ